MLKDRLSMFWGDLQVVAKMRDKERMLALGWTELPTEPKEAENAPEVESEPVVEDAEEAMSNEELSLAIMDCPDKNAVEKLVLIQRKIDIDKRGSLERVKEKALAVINGDS